MSERHFRRLRERYEGGAGIGASGADGSDRLGFGSGTARATGISRPSISMSIWCAIMALGIGTLWRFFERQGISFDKKPRAPPSGTDLTSRRAG